jgi:hypothetical protein
MSAISGDPLGRLPGRFWADASPELDPAGGDRLPLPSGDPKGTPPFSLTPVIPSPTRSLSSSAENLASLKWRKQRAEAISTRRCDRVLDCASWDVTSPDPAPASPPSSVRPTSWQGVKVPVIAPTTFVEHVITASEWTRVRSRGRRSILPPSPASPASRRGFRSNVPSSVWIKKRDAKPTLGPSAATGPTSNCLPPSSPRKSGLHRALGFHWQRKRECAPVRGAPITVMAGRPPPGSTGSKERGTSSSGPFGQQ